MKRSRPGNYGRFTTVLVTVTLLCTILTALWPPTGARGQTPTPTPHCHPTPMLLVPCGLPAAASGAVTHTITTCSGLQNHVFAANQHVLISIPSGSQPCGINNRLLIGSSVQNVYLNGGGVTVQPSSGGNNFVFVYRVGWTNLA